MVPPDMLSEERGVTTFEEQPQQNYTAPELGTQLSTRMWRDRCVTLKLCAGTVFCLACVGVVAAVVRIHPAQEDIATSGSGPAKDTSTKLPDHGSLTSWAVQPDASMAPVAVSAPQAPAESKPTAMVAVATPTPEEGLAAKTAAQPPSLAALRPIAEVAAPAEAPGTTVSTAMPPAASPTGAAPRPRRSRRRGRRRRSQRLRRLARRRPSCASQPRRSRRCWHEAIRYSLWAMSPPRASSTSALQMRETGMRH
jgi:hypothetical protein